MSRPDSELSPARVPDQDRPRHSRTRNSDHRAIDCMVMVSSHVMVIHEPSSCILERVNWIEPHPDVTMLIAEVEGWRTIAMTAPVNQVMAGSLRQRMAMMDTPPSVCQ